MRSLWIRTCGIGVTVLAAAAALAGGCGGHPSGTGMGGTTSSSSSSGGTTPPCTTTAKGPTRGAAVALSSDDKTLITVNRDAGSVTVMSVDYTDGLPKMTTVQELQVGGEPWQV